MRRNSTFSVTCCLVFWVGMAQTKEVALNGKVASEGIGVGNIQIMNLVSEKVVISNAKGEFSISAKEDDLLIFSHPEFEYKRKIVGSEEIQKAKIEIVLTKKPTELDEVVVNNDKSISAEQLGIQGMRELSVAERRQREAGGINKQMLVDYLKYGGIPLSPILNQISGKTNMLRKYVHTETNEVIYKKLSDRYEPEFFVNRYKVLPDYVTGFKYYLAEDEAFGRVLDAGNPQAIGVEMASRALKFNELVALETQ